MKPGKLDLPTIWRGCDYAPITFKWKDLDGNPFDLTGWTPYASTNRFSLNAAVVDVINGVTQVSLTKVQTRTLQLGSQPWTFLFEYTPTGNILPPLLSGTVIVSQPTSNNGLFA